MFDVFQAGEQPSRLFAGGYCNDGVIDQALPIIDATADAE